MAKNICKKIAVELRVSNGLSFFVSYFSTELLTAFNIKHKPLNTFYLF